MREFILSLALDRGRPPIENMLIDKERLQIASFLQKKTIETCLQKTGLETVFQLKI